MTFPPVPASVLWPDESAGPWCVTVWWRVQYGVPTPVGLALTSWWGSGVPVDRMNLPLGSDDVGLPRVEGLVLRQLPITDLMAKTRAVVQARLESGPLVDVAEYEALIAQGGMVASFAETWPGASLEALRGHAAQYQEQAEAFVRSPGTRDLGDAYYRQVAEVYAAAVRLGVPPTKAVRERWGLSPSAAAKQVRRARDRGFLPASSGRGRIGRIEETP